MQPTNKHVSFLPNVCDYITLKKVTESLGFVRLTLLGREENSFTCNMEQQLNIHVHVQQFCVLNK